MEVVFPAVITTSPPAPEFPAPTVTYIEPPLPDCAEPDPKYKAPLLPEEDEPVLKIKIPLTPLEPAFKVCIKRFPLEVELEYPPIRYSPPPLPELEVVAPATMTNSPPEPEFPDPIEI